MCTTSKGYDNACFDYPSDLAVKLFTIFGRSFCQASIIWIIKRVCNIAFLIVLTTSLVYPSNAMAEKIQDEPFPSLGMSFLSMWDDQLINGSLIRDGDRIDQWLYQTNHSIEGMGDFDGNGLDEFIIRSAWGIGLITYQGTRWLSQIAQPNDSWFGPWRYNASVNSGQDKIACIGDFDGDGRDEILATSSWGMGIIEPRGNTFYATVAQSNDSRLGRWRLNTANDKIEGLGDFDGDGQDEILVTSDWGIGILKQRRNSITALIARPNDSWFGDWRYNARVNSGQDQIAGIGDFDGDGRDEILVTSSWGIGILELRGNSLRAQIAQPNNTWFGRWRLNTAGDQIAGVGDLNGDGKDEILMTSNWGIGILEQQGNSLNSLLTQPDNTFFGEWRFRIKDAIMGLGDFNGDERADIIIKSRWGIGLLTHQGDTFTHLTLKPYQSTFGNWTIELWDGIVGIGEFDGRAGADILIQKSRLVGSWRTEYGLAQQDVCATSIRSAFLSPERIEPTGMFKYHSRQGSVMPKYPSGPLKRWHHHIQGFDRLAGVGNENLFIGTRSNPKNKGGSIGGTGFFIATLDDIDGNGGNGINPVGQPLDRFFDLNRHREVTNFIFIPGTDHPGSFQICGQILTIAATAEENSFVVWYDVSDPEQIRQLNHFSVDGSQGEPQRDADSNDFHAGRAAMVRLANNHYLLYVGGVRNAEGWFYISNKNCIDENTQWYFVDFYDSAVDVKHDMQYNPTTQTQAENVAMVTECGTGAIYLFAMGNPYYRGPGIHGRFNPHPERENINLFQLQMDGGEIIWDHVGLRRAHTRGEGTCTFRAGAGVHVSPNHEVIIYCSTHHPRKGKKELKFEEYVLPLGDRK